MELATFIKEHNVDFDTRLVDKHDLLRAETLVGVPFGPLLSDYLLSFGYLGFESTEFYGMNARQGLNSDLILQTLYLHQYFPLTKDYIAIENCGDGDYALVDTNDNVFRFCSENNALVPLDFRVDEYMLEQFLKELS